MATTTTRLGLRKPAGTESYNVTTDLNQNYDKIDAAVGTTLCLSSARPASPFSGQTIWETDTSRFLVWSGSLWIHHSIPVVSATSQILNPFDGQIIFNTTDNMLYRYASSAWNAFAATGTTNHESRYYQNTAQSVPNTTDTTITFETSVYTSADVTKSAGHDTFTLNRFGLWQISAGVRFTPGTSGERHIFLSVNGIGSTNRLAGATAETGLTCSLDLSSDGRFAVNDVIRVSAFQSSGGARLTSISGQSTFISLTWIRP
jgi:hypothetical protein